MGRPVIRRRAMVSGGVQGVGFRYTAQAEAMRRGVAGFARNRPDGTVEIEAEGPESAVGALLAWAASGPPWASVESVDVAELAPRGDTGFDLRSLTGGH